MSDSFNRAWKLAKEESPGEVIPEPVIDDEGMTDCHFPHPVDGWTCPDCCDHHANAGINVCYNCGADWWKYPELGYDPEDAETWAYDPVYDEKEGKE